MRRIEKKQFLKMIANNKIKIIEKISETEYDVQIKIQPGRLSTKQKLIII